MLFAIVQILACVTAALGQQAVPETPSASTPRWLTLPPTPKLPAPFPENGHYAHVNGIKLFYARWTPAHVKSDIPILMLVISIMRRSSEKLYGPFTRSHGRSQHGGLAHSEYLGLQVAALKDDYDIISVDSRGHGRSTVTSEPISYDLMSSDCARHLPISA
jgi:hypothetical protein